MKVKATIVLITVLSGLLVACNADPDGSVVREGTNLKIELDDMDQD